MPDLLGMFKTAAGAFADELMGNEKEIFGIPYAEVKFNGIVFESTFSGISNVEVNMGINGEASTCTISIKGKEKNVKDGKLTIDSNFAAIKIGIKLEVSLGYVIGGKKNISKVFQGFVSDLAMEVDYSGTVNVYVTGMDGKMWLMASHLTKNFGEKKSYSDAVQTIFKKNSSSFSGIKVDKTTTLSTPIYMHNESYYDFCMRAAKVTGNYFFVYLGKLYFVDLKNQKSIERTIRPGGRVRRIMVRSSPFGIPKSVEVKSINEKDASRAVQSKVTRVTGIGEGKDATGLTTNVNGEIVVYDETVKVVSEAKKLAESILNQRAINLVEAEVELFGDPTMKLTTGVRLDGFGKPIDNSYVIKDIQHMCSFKNNEYITILHLSANKYSPQAGGRAVDSLLGAISSFF